MIAGSFVSEANADRQAGYLRQSKGYDARVYRPLDGGGYYAVIIGSYLSLKEAQTLKEQALRDGLPMDTYLWKYQL